MIFENQDVAAYMIEQDSNNSCCLDTSCPIKCLAVCKIYTPGRQNTYIDRLRLGVETNWPYSKRPECLLPSHREWPGTKINCSKEL